MYAFIVKVYYGSSLPYPVVKKMAAAAEAADSFVFFARL